jgi:hypothetical protein
MVRAIGAGRTMHADFGSGRYEGARIGIPFVTVSRSQPKVPVRFEYSDESDRGPYPIPRGVPIEGGRRSDGDRHVIVVDRGRCRLYELLGRDLGPALEPHAPEGVDVGRRGRAADPAGSRPL